MTGVLVRLAPLASMLNSLVVRARQAVTGIEARVNWNHIHIYPYSYPLYLNLSVDNILLSELYRVIAFSQT